MANTAEGNLTLHFIRFSMYMLPYLVFFFFSNFALLTRVECWLVHQQGGNEKYQKVAKRAEKDYGAYFLLFVVHSSLN